MKKTQQHKLFERFVWDAGQFRQEDLTPTWNVITRSGRYKDSVINFGFECWKESARIERDSAKG